MLCSAAGAAEAAIPAAEAAAGKTAGAGASGCPSPCRRHHHLAPSLVTHTFFFFCHSRISLLLTSLYVHLFYVMSRDRLVHSVHRILQTPSSNPLFVNAKCPGASIWRMIMGNSMTSLRWAVRNSHYYFSVFKVVLRIKGKSKNWRMMTQVSVSQFRSHANQGSWQSLHSNGDGY